MIVSVYSFFMAVLWSSLFILLLCLCRRNIHFLIGFGVWPLLAITVCSIVRCFFPLEMLSFTRTVMDSGLVTWIDSFLNAPIAGSVLTLYRIGALVWAAGTLYYLFRSFKKYSRFCKLLRAFEPVPEEDALYAKAQAVAAQLHVRRFTIFLTSIVSTPVVTGFLRPIVLFPLYPYSSEDYRNAFEHEFTHWKNRDIWVKFLVELLCCIFWWNPLIRLLRRNLNQTLELKCDLTVAKKRDKDGRASYKDTLDKTVEFAKKGPVQDYSQFVIAELVRNDGNFNELRKEFILNYKHRPKLAVAAMSFTTCFMVALMVLSYSFVVQPYYEAPEAEIEESAMEPEDCTGIFTEESYLVDNHDGTYSLYTAGQLVTTISSESASMLISDGFSIK